MLTLVVKMDKASQMTSDEFKRIQESIGLDARTLSITLNISVDMIRSIRMGRRKVDPTVALAMRYLDHLAKEQEK